MPRLFTALEIPHDVADELEVMRGGIEGARWIDKASYHVTLRFVGDVEPMVAADLSRALGELRGWAFEAALTGIGSFGSRTPRSIWAGVRRNAALEELHADQESACRRLGLAPETRKFTPHVTLARLRNGRGASAEVQNYIAHHNLYESRPFPVEHFVLLSSRPSRGGGPYVAEEVYPLNGAM
ncbi:MAG: RNA 2',3'-cyclic phosphodiesterase [Hyphomicrobiales bacterium]